MMETLYNIDLGLFQFFNQSCSNSFFDWLMPLITNKYTWIPLYFVLLTYFIIKYKKKSFIPIIALALAVGASDYITSGIIKPNVNRTRPCNIEEANANILAPCRNSPSFPSSHAANHFAIATFMLLLLSSKKKWLKTIFIAWAAAIAYSRVYVGVHFPFDVLIGGVIGAGLGYTFAKLSIKYTTD